LIVTAPALSPSSPWNAACVDQGAFVKAENPDRAVISVAKLVDYLLNDDHPRGASKAWFLRRLGYERSGWRRLRDDLVRQHLGADVTRVDESVHGRHFQIEAILTGPNGRSAMLTSIWIRRPGEDFVRFVTAFPGRRR
jgi:filamentous hemagglutinin